MQGFFWGGQIVGEADGDWSGPGREVVLKYGHKAVAQEEYSWFRRSSIILWPQSMYLSGNMMNIKI
ncbi:hypothetical protein F210042A8_09170 [Blautia parvula]